MSKKKRIPLRLQEDEVAVVGTIERWQHVIMVYETLAKDFPPSERAPWYDMANWIREATQDVERLNGEEDW